MTTSATHSTLDSLPETRRPLNILYADDVRELRDFMCLFLGREGHHVETASDGQSALERLIQAPGAFDLLITDHQMPCLNGLELVTRVRELPFAGKIVVFSSEQSAAILTGYRRLAVDFILSKPSFPASLRSMLRFLFGPAKDESSTAEPPAKDQT